MDTIDETLRLGDMDPELKKAMEHLNVKYSFRSDCSYRYWDAIPFQLLTIQTLLKSSNSYVHMVLAATMQIPHPASWRIPFSLKLAMDSNCACASLNPKSTLVL